ncbi:MAG: riboflavin synthase [Halobacteriovoraceae bacterium]|nr:riboflavin synthase [Halobacteriovoraceae bacterium]MBC99719.1 riboflavin synthase [Halobacteriovoraceae bacterium]|tara:strand:- start:1708 stop:2376 length:669 start_codon:yes stop_codon:yes gene_type:complete
MFTGLIKELGKVQNIERNSEGKKMTFASDELIHHMDIDDSVAINGACQTVISKTANTFTVQAVHTTLDKTTLGELKSGDLVNMELALTLADRLGGHLVQGHVNGIGKISDIKNYGENYVMNFSVEPSLMKYMVKEGSITLNGVSLTISDIWREKNQAQVSIIPHTWNHTIFYKLWIGDKINIEVDILAKYVENLLLYGKEASQQDNTKKSNITEDWLKSKGF